MQAPDRVLQTKDGAFTLLLWNNHTAVLRGTGGAFDFDLTNRVPFFKIGKALVQHKISFEDLEEK